jgi:hypothetical protein
MSGGTESSLSAIDMVGVASTTPRHAPQRRMPMMGSVLGGGRGILIDRGFSRYRGFS